MKTFEEVVSSNSIFDASGTTNPRDWMWEKINDIYYPTKNLNIKSMNTTTETPVEIKYLDLNCKLLIDHVNDEKMSDERRLKLAKIISNLEQIMSTRKTLRNILEKDLYDESGLTDKEKATRDNCYEVNRIFQLEVIKLVCSL